MQSYKDIRKPEPMENQDQRERAVIKEIVHGDVLQNE